MDWGDRTIYYIVTILLGIYLYYFYGSDVIPIYICIFSLILLAITIIVSCVERKIKIIISNSLDNDNKKNSNVKVNSFENYLKHIGLEVNYSYSMDGLDYVHIVGYTPLLKIKMGIRVLECKKEEILDYLIAQFNVEKELENIGGEVRKHKIIEIRNDILKWRNNLINALNNYQEIKIIR